MTLIDRSRIVARMECPRLRYLNYHFGGTGIERVRMALPLVNGIHIHAILADVLTTVPFDDGLLDAILSRHLANYAEEVRERGVGIDEDVEFLIAEQSALIEGLVRGWVKVRMPALLDEYEVVSVEEEMQWELAPGLIQMLRLDGLLRHKQNKLLYILEFKSAASTGYGWQQGWEKNIQFMSYTQAVKELTGEECGGVIVEGLIKGTRRVETAQSSPFFGRKIQSSPFCYAFAMPIGRNGSDGSLLQTTWAKGAKKTLVTEHVPMKVWIEEMHAEGTLSQQFVQVPPISPLGDQILRWRRQTIAAETRFSMALTEVAASEDAMAHLDPSVDVEELQDARAYHMELLDFHLPQHDNHCMRYGSPCSFYEACFEMYVAEDPLGSGLYQKRNPHHTPELEQ